MMLPLLCTRHGIPFMGARPILRGISDDKHSTKLEAKERGVPTSPWAIYSRGAPVGEAAAHMAERMETKPNASSGRSGVMDEHERAGVGVAGAEMNDMD